MEQHGISELRAAGMTVIDDVDGAAFVRRLAEARPLFEQRFGREALQRIEDAKRLARAPHAGTAAP